MNFYSYILKSVAYFHWIVALGLIIGNIFSLDWIFKPLMIGFAIGLLIGNGFKLYIESKIEDKDGCK